MKIVGRRLLHTFGEKHSDARNWIRGWLAEAELSTWTSPQHIKKRYASASFLANNLVIFNVKGNHYRLEVRVAYETEVILIRWIGTHAEYDRRNLRRQ